MFTIVEHSSKYPGLTGEYPNPSLEAYKYMAMLLRQGRTWSSVYHTDGAVSVESAGLETSTFAPIGALRSSIAS
jgi:hypothetical protein